jgi:hypothetical protein
MDVHLILSFSQSYHTPDKNGCIKVQSQSCQALGTNSAQACTMLTSIYWSSEFWSYEEAARHKLVAQVQVPWQATEGCIAEDVRRTRPPAEAASAQAELAQRLQMIEANNARQNLLPKHHDLNAVKLRACSTVAGPMGEALLVTCTFLHSHLCIVRLCPEGSDEIVFGQKVATCTGMTVQEASLTSNLTSLQGGGPAGQRSIDDVCDGLQVFCDTPLETLKSIMNAASLQPYLFRLPLPYFVIA